MGAQLEVGGQFHTEETIKGTLADHTTVRGSSTVSWTFLENETDKTGVVTSMRGPIL